MARDARAKSMNALELKRLKELLNYDPDTGAFTWKVSKGTVSAGSVAGRFNDEGYISIKIDSKEMKAHRLAWLYVHGNMPEDQIDHINGKRNDNRILNLRLVTYSENQQNLRAARSDNKTGYLGVSRSRNKFLARICVNKKIFHLGMFDDPASAYSAYVEAKRKLHSHGQL